MSKIASPLARRAALALIATVIGAAPALAEGRVLPASARLSTGTPLAEAYAIFQPATATASAMKVSMLQRCTRSGTRMVC